MSELKAGRVLGHYKVVRKLGAGGMADVYEAEDLKLGRTVALKVLPPELMRNPQLAARFKTEVRAAASLNHRSIVTVFEVGEANDVLFYSMRLLTGGDLRGRIRDGMRSIEALAVLRDLSGAFDHAHNRGFVHRDVKPENILFDGEGLPVLTDFGIAKALGSDSQLTATGVSIGTPRYFSPEQARGRPVDARSDLYSLGIILYEMLTGSPPYVSDDAVAIVFQHVNDPIPKLPDEHAYLQPLLEALMAKDPGQRIGSARELRYVISSLGGFGHTPQPINLGEESELVQRLLAGDGSAPVTPAPRTTSRTATVITGPRVREPEPEPPASHGQIYEVEDDEGDKPPPDEEDATVRRPPPTRKGEKPAKVPTPAPKYQTAPPKAPQAPQAPQALIINRPPRRPDPEPTRSGRSLTWVAAGVLVAASAIGAFVVRQGPEPEPVKAPPVQKPAPAVQPAVLETPAAKAPEPAPVTVAPTPAPQVVKAAPAKAAPVPAPKVVKPVAPAPAPVVKSTPAPAPAATFTPAPAAQPAPQPAPQEEAVAPKATPRPEPAKPKPVAAKPATAPAEADDEEEEFLRERAEQLRRERERRDAAQKKEEELRKAEESQ